MRNGARRNEALLAGQHITTTAPGYQPT